jgi:hypothetical protein
LTACPNELRKIGSNNTGQPFAVAFPQMDVEQLNRISFLIIESAIEIHRAIGAGLLERTYRTCMML